MFGFLSRRTKGYADPLQNRKVASAWFGKLPALDVLGRQEQVIHAFEAMRRSWTEISRHRISAIAYIDAAFEGEHRRLVQWYLENLEMSPRLAARFRQAAVEVNQTFLDAYQTALDPVCGRAANPRWKPLIPLLFTRLIRCHGIDAKSRLFNREQWIPARWIELHQLFLRATELGVERLPVTIDKTDPFAAPGTAEQEYVYALLIHQLDTGNLAPAELQWASTQLRAWTHDVKVDAVARAAGGFYVDLAGSKGLVRRTGNDQGEKVGYVDTTTLAQQLDLAIAKLSESQAGVDAASASMNRRHIAVLEKIRPALMPTRAADLRRHPRIPVDIAAAVQIGLADISLRLADKTGDDARTAFDKPAPIKPVDGQTFAPSQRLVPRVPATRSDGSRGTPRHLSTSSARFEALRFDAEDAATLVTQVHDGPSTDDNAFAFVGWNADGETAGQTGAEALWRLKDRSAAGWRVCAPVSVGQNLDLDALVAVRPSDAGDWMLGVVRRVHKRANQLEAGVALIADRVVAVTLHARRPAKEDMSVVVDGVDLAAIGPRFAGLYLLPPTRPGTRVSIRTLVLPAPEYAEGRRLVLVTGRWNYTIVLRHLIEGSGEWSWATMQIAERLPRAA